MIAPPIKPHDLGGQPAGAVDRTEKEHLLWEKRVDALMMLLQRKGLLYVDELRKNIEALGPSAYTSLSYYERWITAIANTLLERGVVTSEELGRGIDEVLRRERVLP